MLFNSLAFIVFFIIVTVLYFNLPYRHRWLLLLAASCFFYMYFIPVYILILVFTIIIDYFAGIFIEKSEGRIRKRFLYASLVANIGVLAVFKYFNFLNGIVTDVLGTVNYVNEIPFLKIALPVGLSFHTFQAMSYTIEIYRRNFKAERHFGIYALYVMYFPQLVVGPIERPQNLLPQLKANHDFDAQRTIDGLRIMLFGFFKKMVVADNLSFYVNEVYGNPFEQTGTRLLFASVLFGIQIFCDFSGYSDIAIGASKIFGIDLMQNFKTPYFSKSIPEFWKRWHISLTTWFRDYLYFTLGGSHVSKKRFYLNILIVFGISGLWHGANWTYIIWGLLHALFYLGDKISLNGRKKMFSFLKLYGTGFLKIISVVFTMVLVDITWVFFRAKNVAEAFYMFEKMVTDFRLTGLFDSAFLTNLIFGILGWIVLEVIQVFQQEKQIHDVLKGRKTIVRWGFYYVLFALILFTGYFGRVEFIYFQF